MIGSHPITLRRVLGYCAAFICLFSALSLDFSAAEANENYSMSTESSSNTCFEFGCPFLPRDVFYDENAKTALHRLKEATRKIHHEEEENKASRLFLSELDSSGDRHRTTMTLRGYKGGSISEQINQDRSILVSPFLKEYQLLGVLDGHGLGGEAVAEYARQEMPKQVAEKVNRLVERSKDGGNMMRLDEVTTQKVVKILKNVFLQVDKSSPEASKSGGCTASVTLQLGNKLFVANAGDSVTLVAAHRAWNESNAIVYKSREDKPDLPDERERIEKAGGRVQIPRMNPDGDTSRVIYKDPKSKMDVGLAMSRSIGDWDAPGVTAEPIVDVLDLDELAATVVAGNHECDCDGAELECGASHVNFMVVSATDGLVDFVTPQAIVDKIGITFFGRPSRQSGTDSGHAHLAVEELIYLAARGWHEDMHGTYRDDITVTAAKVLPWEANE